MSHDDPSHDDPEQPSGDGRARPPFHMTPDEFRRAGHEAIEWIASYLERVEELPVLSRVEPGQIRAELPDHPPKRGEPFSAMLADVERLLLPGITHWQSPSFFAFFPANSSGPAVLGELLSAGLGVQGMLWATSPACTELETHVLDWLVEMLDLPPRFRSDGPGGGVIQDSASSATLCALLAARHRALAAGAAADRLVAYTSTQAHSSVEKATRIAGLATEQLRLIEVDARFALRPEALEQAVRADREAGRVPFYLCATVGTTASHGLDPLRALGELAAGDPLLWLHVDAAMAGTAALCPEHRGIHDGLERCDSYCFNPHKWMFTNFDCDCFYLADRRPLIEALSVLPEYLRNAASEAGAVIDYRDWQVPLGRRFRALKLWFVIRHYGVEGLRHQIREHLALARRFAGWVADDPRFELAAPVPLNLVCFRHADGDEASQRLLEALNATGELYLTHAVLDGRYALRFCVGQTRTEARHVEAAWALIDRLA